MIDDDELPPGVEPPAPPAPPAPAHHGGVDSPAMATTHSVISNVSTGTNPSVATHSGAPAARRRRPGGFARVFKSAARPPASGEG